jgi:hypothetical protein
MAHSCPNCGSACYCHGDIEDCLLPSREAEAACTCCPDPDDCDDAGFWDEFDQDDIDRCDYCGSSNCKSLVLAEMFQEAMQL